MGSQALNSFDLFYSSANRRLGSSGVFWLPIFFKTNMLNFFWALANGSVSIFKPVRCLIQNGSISRGICTPRNSICDVSLRKKNFLPSVFYFVPRSVTIFHVSWTGTWLDVHRDYGCLHGKQQLFHDHATQKTMSAKVLGQSPRIALTLVCGSRLVSSKEHNKKNNQMRENPPTLARRVEGVVLKVIHLILALMFRIIYRGRGETVPPINNLLLLDSGTTLALKIRTKKVTSVEVLETFINRIKEVNGVLNAVVDTRFEEAIKEAAAADALIRSGQYSTEELAQKFPFLGVPFTIKDCVAVKGLKWTAGLYKRRNLVATEDAGCIAAMKSAGAIIIAVTNCSELCMWWESNNTVYGRSRNPYNTNRIVGGSSGGEGAIQGAAGSAIGLGTDIGGSIRMPAFFNGVFGHKPSRGVGSNSGQWPNAYGEQMTYLGTGPIVRNAGDLLPVLRVLAGPETSERLHLNAPLPEVRNLRVFYMEDDGGGRFISPVQPELKECIRKAIAHLEAQGVKAEKVKVERLRKAGAIWFAKMQVPEAVPFTTELTNLEGSINPYWELMKWMVGASKHTFVALVTTFTSSGGFKCGTEKHARYVDECTKLRREFQDMLGDNAVFLYPTHPTVAPFHNEPVFKPYNFHYTSIWNVLGFPATSVPMGLGSAGVPLGLQVIANADQDRLNIAVALELERAFGGWVPPAVAV